MTESDFPFSKKGKKYFNFVTLLMTMPMLSEIATTYAFVIIT